MGGNVPGFPDPDGGIPPRVVDGGTNALTDNQQPGVIGLDARTGGGASRTPPPAMGDQIVAFAQARRGHSVGDGQCFALADQALKSASAKSAADFGTVDHDADYVWGSATSVVDAKPGDVIQFRDYRYDREITTDLAGGASDTRTDFQERPHHTAIVASVDGGGAITVLEQNAPDGSPTRRTQLFFLDRDDKTGNKATKITIQGTFTIYRPQHR